MRQDRGAEVECVYIPEEDRGTLCVSSQVGCTLTCAFCHTGHAKARAQFNRAGDYCASSHRPRKARRFSRRRAAGRRSDAQAATPARSRTSSSWAWASRSIISTMSATRWRYCPDGDGLSLSKRRITVSTAGVVPRLSELGAETGAMLAISLHAVRDELRDRLVPLNKKYPIAELLQACRTYPGASNARRITFEYVMLKGINDSPRRRARTGAPAERRSGQDQSDPVQSLARNAPSNARTTRRSGPSPTSSSTPAMRAPCARRAGATSSPPAASSRARRRSCARGRCWRPESKREAQRREAGQKRRDRGVPDREREAEEREARRRRSAPPSRSAS